MQFRIMGPVEVQGVYGISELGGGRPRAVLAALALDANEVVAHKQLIAATWVDAPPSTAGPLHNVVSRLRRALAAVEPGGGSRIVTRGGGYLLVAEPDEVDLGRFRAHVGRARADIATGAPERALEWFQAALDLWRGPVSDGPATVIEEVYLSTVEEHFELRSQIGSGAELLPELETHIAAHPLRERPRVIQMLVLSRVGRRSEALATYHEFHRLLRDERGTEPAPPLQEAHRRILAGGTGLPPVPRRAAASMHVSPRIPLDVTQFTGRRRQLALLDGALQDGPLWTIEGSAGIGKTGLALHWAHRAAAATPDGQLYVNLRAFDRVPPTEPAEALAGFLRALGVPEKMIPIDVDERAAAFRSLVAGRRMLVVLDNAASAGQVRPLLPGSASVLVLVTSRRDLRGLAALEGARRLVLDVLSADEARTLVRRTVGEARAGAEPEAVDRLVELCGRLPLALRIAAGHLLRNDHSIAEYVALLAGGDRLDRLRNPDDHAAVRASFDLSYEHLTAAGAQLFRLLGLLPTPDFTPHVAAALGDLPLDRATELLAELGAGHLIEVSVSGRLQVHDLVRHYAAGRAEQEDGAAGCATALRRFEAFYLQTVDAAARLVYPDRESLLDRPGAHREPLFTERLAAMEWLDAERAAVLTVVRHTAEAGEHRTCWQLAHALGAYYYRQMNVTDWRETTPLGLAAAVRAGDVRGRIAMLSSEAHLWFSVADYHRALDRGEEALRLVGEAGGHPGLAEIVRVHGTACWLSGRLAEAVQHFSRAVGLYRHDGNPVGEAHAHIGLAASLEDLGRWEEALRTTTVALDLGSHSASPVTVGLTLHTRAAFLGRLGRFDEALEQLTEARTQYDRTKAAYHLPFWHFTSALVHRGLGDRDRALADARAALELGRSVGERRTEANARTMLGLLAADAGHADAVEYLAAGRDLAARLRLRRVEIEAGVGLVAVLAAAGRTRDALRVGERALATAREHGYPLGEAEALLAIAGAHRARGARASAVESAELALATYRRIRHQLGESRAIRLLDDIDPARPAR